MPTSERSRFNEEGLGGKHEFCQGHDGFEMCIRNQSRQLHF